MVPAPRYGRMIILLPGALCKFRCPKRSTIPALVALIAFTLSRGASGQMPTTKVVVVEARRVEAPTTIVVVGTVEPIKRSRVSSEIAGRIDAMPGREGDRVESGAVICKLDDTTFRLRLAEERAELEALNARHAELLAGTRPEELSRLQAVLDEAGARLDRWKFEMARVEELYAGRESNDKEYFDTKAEFLAADRRKIAAQAAYNLGVEGPRKETILQAASAVAKQNAVVDRASDELSKTSTRAPFSGYIVERVVEVGEWLNVGDPVVEMVDLSAVLVRVHVPESALPHIKRNDAARVRIDALERSYDGHIEHIMRQADPRARTFPIHIRVENSDEAIAAGMFARATVPAGRKSLVVVVPKDAIVERDGTVYVATLILGREGKRMGVLTPVTLGADVGDWIAITSNNIEKGTKTITRGTERMLPFPTPVEIVDRLGTPVETKGETSKPKGTKMGAATPGFSGVSPARYCFNESAIRFPDSFTF